MFCPTDKGQLLNFLGLAISKGHLQETIGGGAPGVSEAFREVFGAIQATNLKLNPKKRCLLQRKVKFLGHFVSIRVTTDSRKVESIQQWSFPRNIKKHSAFGVLLLSRSLLKPLLLSNASSPMGCCFNGLMMQAVHTRYTFLFGLLFELCL